MGRPRIYVLLLKQDDPRKCTAQKLVRFDLAQALRHIKAVPPKTVLLDPYAPLLAPEESRFAASFTAVDGSWARAREVFSRRIPGLRRRLPHLLAANPIHYGHLDILSSVEALATALHLAGHPGEAERLLQIFKWGPTFLSLNREPLEAYAQAEDRDQLLRLEKEFFST